MRSQTHNMVQMATWHWQERFESMDIEEACRRQILKIGSSKSHSHWLKEKIRASKQSRTYEPKDEVTSQDNQAECDAAFRDFLRRKRTDRRHKSAADTTANLQSKPWQKPPSLHVNPKTTEGSSRKAERGSMAKANGSPILHRERSQSENQQAYDAWLARVRLEDQVRRTQRRDKLDQLDQQQLDRHKVTWRKKLAVCAYSTLVITS